MAPPMKECMFDLMFDSGASQTGALVDIGVELDIIQKSGAWFAYDGTKIGQGRENAKAYLEENPEIAAVIQKQVFEHFGIVDNDDIDPSIIHETKSESNIEEKLDSVLGKEEEVF